MPQQPKGDWFDQHAPTAKDLFDQAAQQDGTHPGNQNQPQPAASGDIWDAAASYQDLGGSKPDWFEQDRQRAANTPPTLKQPVRVESSALDVLGGSLAPRDVPRTKGAGSKQGDLPGFEGSYASGDNTKGAAYSAAGVVAGSALAAPAVATALRSAAAAHPLVAKVIIKGLEGLGFGAGLKLAGKHMDLLDFLGTK